MRIIHVLRKPLSEGTVASNVLKHGCGGLNIDASRIKGLEGEHIAPGGLSTPSNRTGAVGRRLFHEGKDSKEAFQQAQLDSIERANNLGRWPANVILQHLDGCRCDGVKRVKASAAGKKVERETDTCIYGEIRYAGKDGKETVADWICEPDCPVARLDEQSGDRSSPWVGNPNRGKKGGQMFGGQTDNLSDLSKPEYRDTGGASRFYKQVGGKSDG